ncbi:acetylornithine transaminase [Robertmurraya korlensis]|uniref:acetylornithine transaminase n=1 Tax=Robertmurraya korlensis TaxID=519977 RepID=UPI00203E5F6F|nr:acetylornithine transaminase [Robertmurraya korlensis]MCM3602393.1 acetylornithine transaminase [Robertmurraya korlensis]
MSGLFPTYARWEVEPAKAVGSYLYDINNKKYLDFTSGIGVCNLGHQPEAVKKAVIHQLDQFWHVSNLFPQEKQVLAAKMLADAAGLEAVFFANSGAEANEGAIKLARKATGRTKIITFQQSFHGRTFATMSATGQDKIKEGYGNMLETFVYVPFNDINSLKAEMSHEVAAVMLEVIQGEGGIHVGEEAFLKDVEKLCKEYGALFVIDEIQTGIGRTGKPFAFQQYDLSPDIVTSAKGLGSGFPIGAVIGTEQLVRFFGPGSHGSTFGGNPVSISAAIATMEEIFAPEFLESVVKKGEYTKSLLEQELKDISVVKEIRGSGLMIGIELQNSVGSLLKDLRESGLLALPAGENVLRLLPPLTVTEEQINEAVNIIKMVLQKSYITA